MTLRSRLRRFRRRLWTIGSATALAWGLAAATVLLLAAAWLDLLWELSPQARMTLAGIAGTAGLAALGGRIATTVRAAGQRSIARRVDRAGNLGGQVLTGLELEHRTVDEGGTGAALSPLTAGLARLAVGRATAAVAEVRPADAVPARPLRRAGVVLLALAAVVALLAAALPGLARTQLDRFLYPNADVPPFSPLVVKVEPGDARVVYGSPLEIHAELLGGAADRADLVLEHPGEEADVLPMFPEADGRWRTVLAAVTREHTYHVRAYRARSPRYAIEVITVPRIEEVRVRIVPPEYTGEAAYEGPVPKDGIAGLPGTEVRLWVRSNRPLSGGTLEVELDAPAALPTEGDRPARDWSLFRPTDAIVTEERAPKNGPVPLPANRDSAADQLLSTADTPSAAKIGTAPAAMQPAASEAHEAVGQFAIAGDGKLVVRVVDTAGQPSQEAFTTTITQLKDQRPLVRIVEPPAQSLATPDAVLPVLLSAEDDYGVSRLQLFRSLNDSRPLPGDEPLPDRPARRMETQVDLPLAAYGLQPGDAIKLFGRVEDNDPVAAKGAESTVATVRIISQEEFERLVQLREGLDALMSKYREADRRLEGLEDAVDSLLTACDAEPPEAAVGQQRRGEAERLAARLRDEAAALRSLAERSLPLDIDQALTDELEAMTRAVEQMAEQLEELLDEDDLNHEALGRQLEKLMEELGRKRGHFRQAVMAPLETLEAFFPLMADQSRFVMLVLRQIDLADRLAALRDRDGDDDDPALRARMRDLEDEQRAVREALIELLADMEQHAEQLPEAEEIEPLRQAVREFVAQVRASGAIDAMAEAERALVEFAGSRAYEQARLAAELLSEFLTLSDDDCLGGMACRAMLAFRPGLGGSLGNTIPQMLEAMGLSPNWGSGSGMGGGGAGGFSAMRGGFQSMGLYGMLPGMGRAYSAGRGAHGRGSEPGFGGAGREGANPDQRGWDGPATPADASGMGEAAAPLRYRRRVGEYFRRLAEELSAP